VVHTAVVHCARRFCSGRLPRGVKLKSKLSLQNALSLVYDIYARKIMEDEIESRDPYEATPLADFLKFFFLTKFGLVSLAENNLYGVVDAVQRLSRKSVRLRLFGQVRVRRRRSHTLALP